MTQGLIINYTPKCTMSEMLWQCKGNYSQCICYPIWPISLLAVYQVSPYKNGQRKRTIILFGSLVLSKQPKSFILFIQSLHLIILTFLLVQLHLLAEQGAKEAVNCTLFPCSPVLRSHEVL